MKTRDFFFDLPGHLIAQYPPERRGDSRLMALDRSRGIRRHCRVADLPSILQAGDLLVFNNSKVRKARLYGISKNSGARTEFLLIKKVDEKTWTAMAYRSKRRRTGSRYIFQERDGGAFVEGEITGGAGEERLLTFDRAIDDDWLDRNGHVPLPPYIKREDTDLDGERYQTVYAEASGSAAAPTAGLHFTRSLLDDLAGRGIGAAFVTLHVGLGTFLPVRSENIEDHAMHEEIFSIGEECAGSVEKARSEGRRIIAVGTTSVRTLESAWDENAGRLRRGEGATSIFIRPPYRFKAVDALFTNFHTPGSTLLMLVSAFAGREFILESYAEAVREGYRFFSYGDAMLIL